MDVRTSRTCCGLEPTPAVEDTLRIAFVLDGLGEPATTSMIAQQLGVRPPTVSSMLKRLEQHGLVSRTDSQGVVLTEHGASHARDVVRRHRLLETFFVEVLGMPPDEVHQEADALEHGVSDVLADRIDVVLGRPENDPHGDPIPRRGHEHAELRGVRLDAAPAPSRFIVQRVHDWDAAALRHLRRLGIRPGVVVDVIERDPFGGPLWVRLEGKDHALGDGLTRLVHGTSHVDDRSVA